MIYFIMFIMSILLLILSIKLKKYKIVRIILIILSLILPCILAALRGLSVGTDTSGYVYNLYKGAKSINTFEGMVSYSDFLYYSKDYAYLFVNYFISKSGLSFQVLLFIFECLIVMPIFLALKINSKDDKDIVLGMSIFYLIFYNLSLNMLRQSIAIAFVLLAFSIFKNRERNGQIIESCFSIIILLIGCMFHDTAIIAVLLFAIYWLFDCKKINNKFKYILFFILIGLSLGLIFFYKPILTYIGTSGIYPKALMYIKRFAIFDFNYLGTFRDLLLLLIVFLSKNIYKKNNENYLFIILLAAINALIGLLGTFISYADRIAYYSYFTISLLFIPLLFEKNRKINWQTITIIIFFILYWVIVILINNSNGTLPYVLYK